MIKGINTQTTFFLEVIKYMEILLREEFKDDVRYDQKLLLQSIMWNEAANFILAHPNAEPYTGTDILGCLFTNLVKKGPISIADFLPQDGLDFTLNHIDGQIYHVRLSPIDVYLKDFFNETIAERDKRVAQFIIRNLPQLVRAGNNLIDAKALDEITNCLVRVASENYFLTNIDLFNITLFLKDQYNNSRYPFNAGNTPFPCIINSSGRDIYLSTVK